MLTGSVFQTVWTNKLNFEQVWQDLLTTPIQISRAEMFKGGDILTSGFLCLLLRFPVPLALLHKVFEIAETDPQKRNLASIRNSSNLLPLHVALKSGQQSLEVIKTLVHHYPQALLEHIHPSDPAVPGDPYLEDYTLPSNYSVKTLGLKTATSRYLKSAEKSYFAYLIRISTILCVNKMSRTTLFGGLDVPVFEKKDKGGSGMKSKRGYFAYSVLRFLNEREMKPLANEIYSYIGCNQNGPGVLLADAKDMCPLERICDKKVRKMRRAKEKKKYEQQQRVKAESRRKESLYREKFESFLKEGKSRQWAHREARESAGIAFST